MMRNLCHGQFNFMCTDELPEVSLHGKTWRIDSVNEILRWSAAPEVTLSFAELSGEEWRQVYDALYPVALPFEKLTPSSV